MEALLSSGFGARAWAAHQAANTLQEAADTFTKELRKAAQVGGMCCACALGAGGFTSILQVAKLKRGHGAKACLAPLPFPFLWKRFFILWQKSLGGAVTPKTCT